LALVRVWSWSLRLEPILLLLALLLSVLLGLLLLVVLLLLGLLLLLLGRVLLLCVLLLEFVQQQMGEFQIIARILLLWIHLEAVAVIRHGRTQVRHGRLGLLEVL
jgi:hypothetical protein